MKMISQMMMTKVTKVINRQRMMRSRRSAPYGHDDIDLGRPRMTRARQTQATASAASSQQVPETAPHLDDVQLDRMRLQEKRASQEAEAEARVKQLREAKAEVTGDNLEGMVIEVLLEFVAEPQDAGRDTSFVNEMFAAERSPTKKNVKRKIEVSTQQLNPDDRRSFEAAKAKE